MVSVNPTKKRTKNDSDQDDDEDFEDDDLLLLSDNEERETYDDFFDPPTDGSSDRKQKKEKKQTKLKKRKNATDDDNDGQKIEGANSSVRQTNGVDEADNLDKKSEFEIRQIQLRKQIESIENDMLTQKPWQLSGETDAHKRPENSLLEEYIQFDRNTRLPPVITTETTDSIEQLIKQRIKDKTFDDVERKKKTADDANAKTYKKELILEHEKSKISLAQVYEQEYLKKTDAR